MKRLAYSWIFFAVILSPALFALTSFSHSPLLPGTKVVAGDLNKNEFFILSDQEERQIQKPKQPTKQFANADNSNAFTSKIKISLQQPHADMQFPHRLIMNKMGKRSIRKHVAFNAKRKRRVFHPVIKNYQDLKN